MSEGPNHTPTPLSIEEGISLMFNNSRRAVRDRYQKYENRVKKSPASAVLGAVAVGFLLNRLPVRAILATQIRMVSALAKPALLLFGVAKLFSFLQNQQIARPK